MVGKKKISLLLQIAILFVIGVILVNILFSWELNHFTSSVVMSNQIDRAEAAAKTITGYFDRYPARDWLLRYWYEHYDELDIEYDAAYSADTETAQKFNILRERHPGFTAEYAEAKDAEMLPEEDQKLFAEIMYSRLISHIDQLKDAHNLSYIFGVVTEEPYDRQIVLFISSRPGAVRGTEEGQIYPIGTEMPITEARRDAVRSAVAGEPRLSYNEDNKYVDYYYSLGAFETYEVLIGTSVYIAEIEESIRSQTGILRAMSMLFLVLLAAVLLFMILLVVLRPLKTIQKNISLYKNTRDSRTVAENLSKIRSHNEIEELSGDVAAMAEDLTAYMIRDKETAVREERVRTELGLARKIQAAVLPSGSSSHPDRKEFDICASMTPAREVGGDFYDFFLADDDRLCMVIADVSGKGVPAALYMMAAKTILSLLVKSGKSPSQILAEANNTICSNNPEEMFITVWLGILDLSTGKMICANAGHEFPVLKKPGGRYELIQDKHGFVLGGMEDMKYSEYELQMEPGSSLFLYTDGLPEAMNPDKLMFGTARILQDLNKEPERSPEKVLQSMSEAVDVYIQGMEPFDDLTMMCIAYHGPEK